MNPPEYLRAPEPTLPPFRVLVAGCGYVGTELGLQLTARTSDPADSTPSLAARAPEVWGLRRDPSGIPAPIRPITADLLDSKLDAGLPLVDAVIYAASADSSDPEPYRRAYIDGVRNLMAALVNRGAPVRHFIFVSSTVVYGDSGGNWVDEETPTVPDNFRGELILEGERAALGGPFPATILRLGGIYGPGRRRLIEQVRSGRATCPDPASGNEDTWSNRIHRDDAAGILAHLLELGLGRDHNQDLAHDHAHARDGILDRDPSRNHDPNKQPRPRPTPHSIYLGVDHEPARLCDVYTYVAGLLGVPAPATSSTSVRQRSNKRCSSRRIREAGYRFRFPTFREGYGGMLEEDEASR